MLCWARWRIRCFAEIALQRGYLDVAVQSYTDLVVRTRDPQIMARAIEVAGFAQRFDAAREIARRWIEIDPTSRRAQRMWVNTLILDNRYDELTPLLIRSLEGDKERLPKICSASTVCLRAIRTAWRCST